MACLTACTTTATDFDGIPLRNPTVPIGAITRFEPQLFVGDWTVVATAGGDWDLDRFTVGDDGASWREGGEAARAGRLAVRAPGILRLEHDDGTARDLWIVWIDPDHRTAAIGDPDGRFGFVAVRGKPRADQIAAAKQVLDFNGYRTGDWPVQQTGL